MISYPVNTLLAFPFTLVVCVLDTWLVFAVLLLAARYLAGDRWNIQNSLLHAIVEGPVHAMRERLLKWRRRTVAPWIPWAATCGAVVVLRQLLAGLLSAMS